MPRLSPVSYKDLIRVFEGEGYRIARTEGDHVVMTKAGVSRPIVIPKLRTGGVTRDRYFELLGQGPRRA